MIDLVINKTNLGIGVSEIYFRIGDLCFPSIGWTDLDLAVLQWAEEIDSLGSSGMLSFMDGPYYFRIQRNSEDAYVFEFFTKEDDEVFWLVKRYVASKKDFNRFMTKIQNGRHEQ